MDEETSREKPVGEVRLGNIKATIWRNETAAGARFNVNIERLYKSDNGRWVSTTNFGLDDLLVVAKVADLAHSRVYEYKCLE